jgi:hypothetical protein
MNIGVMEPYFKTELGKLYIGHVEELLATQLGKELQGKVQLLLTSPPFPLNHKKAYGNYTGEEYVRWLGNFAPLFALSLMDRSSLRSEMRGSPIAPSSR